MVRPIRVLTWEVPAMLGGIFAHVVEKAQDIELAGAPTATRVEDAIAQSAADVLVVMSEGGDDTQHLEELLLRFPRLKVLAVLQDGRRSFLHELHLRSIPLGELSPDDFLSAIRNLFH